MCQTVWSSTRVARCGADVSHRNASRFSAGTYQYVPSSSPSHLHRDESSWSLPAAALAAHNIAPTAVKATIGERDRGIMSRPPRIIGVNGVDREIDPRLG